LEIVTKLDQNFKSYGPIDNVFDEGTTELAHIPGEVLFIELWATWCEPSEERMKRNRQMASNNEKDWKDKVRLLVISADRKKEVIKQEV
jgi:thiol-disulfide isomerase/thioredoxin